MAKQLPIPPAEETKPTELETPVTEVKDERTAEQIAADELEQAKALVAKQNAEKAKVANAAKIKELEDALSAAKADRKKWDLDLTDPDQKEFHDFQIAKNANWLTDKDARIADAEKALKDFKLGLLTPEEKAAQVKWDAAKSALATAQAEYDKVKAEILAAFPDFFGSAKAPAKVKDPNAPKKEVAGTTEIRPFTGKLLDTEDLKKRVLDLHNSGTTSESEIIKAIYGDGFTISGDARVNIGNGNPRSQVHSMRDSLGLIPTKA